MITIKVIEDELDDRCRKMLKLIDDIQDIYADEDIDEPKDESDDLIQERFYAWERELIAYVKTLVKNSFNDGKEVGKFEAA